MVNKKASDASRLIRPSMLVALGAVLLAAGFVYDLLFAGIPYQDPTPEMAARYDRHGAIATVIYWCGAVAFLGGIIAAIFRSLFRRHAVGD
jgi:hypothetical protein